MTTAQLKQLPVLPPFTVRVDGEDLLVDSRTFTMKEHRLRRRELTRISVEDDLQPDDADVIAVSVWVVLRRTQPGLPLDDVLEALSYGDLVDRQPVTGEGSDPEA